MADANLEKIAIELGLEVRHSNMNSNIQISGKTSEVLRAWAVAGYDRQRQSEKSYIFSMNGQYAGSACCLPEEDFVFSSTPCQ